jgi:hypothetical protein
VVCSARSAGATRPQIGAQLSVEQGRSSGTSTCRRRVDGIAPQTYWDLRWHIVAAPTLVDAKACGFGVSKSMTYIPIWGIAIGFFTFGILVPQWTGFSCVAPAK